MFGDVKVVVITAQIIVCIVTNLLVIVVIARHEELRQDRTTMFVLSLSVSDLATGCLVMPINAAVCSKATPSVHTFSQYLPKIHLFLSCWFVFNSLHSLSWVAVTKAVALLKPLRFEQLLTRNRCYGIIAFNWVVGGALAATRLAMEVTWHLKVCVSGLSANNSEHTGLAVFTHIVSFVVPRIVLVVATVRIFFVVLRTHSRITAQQQSVVTGSSRLVTLKAIRSARNVLVICFVAIALTAPVFIVWILRSTLHRRVATAVTFTATWLFNCNAFMNSSLYLTLFRSMRHKTTLTFVAVCEFFRGA